jgi:uncharacterized membrane protein
LDLSRIRKSAREALRGNWGMAIVVVLIYIMLSSLDQWFTGLNNTETDSSIFTWYDAFSLIWMILTDGALTLGLTLVFLNLTRYGKVEIEQLFTHFMSGERYVKSVAVYLLQFIYIVLWSLLLVIPGIVKSYSYAMTFYILNDHPELSPNEAITRSRQMMKGHKLELFALQWSFIGWGLLSILTLGIGFLWLIPYYYAAEAQFYITIKEKAEGQSPISQHGV